MYNADFNAGGWIKPLYYAGQAMGTQILFWNIRMHPHKNTASLYSFFQLIECMTSLAPIWCKDRILLSFAPLVEIIEPLAPKKVIAERAKKYTKRLNPDIWCQVFLI